MTQTAGSPPTSFRFTGWELRPQERVLLIGGNPVRVGSRAFDVLLALAEQSGRVVGKNELLSLAWPGRVVEENNLSVQIAALRKLLGASAIVNVSGFGYRLAAMPLTDLPPMAARDCSALPATPPQPGPAPSGPLALVGRDDDLRVLSGLVGRNPLVTITGPGGVGKTTLARALVAALAEPPADGVHWIDLAPLHRGTPLLPHVVKALGMLPGSPDTDVGDLSRALSARHALFVLDNCEHLLDDVAALLAPLLSRPSGLCWLATSQESLGLPAEMAYRLSPLQVPAPGADLQTAAADGALALFCRRVRAAGGQSAWPPQALALAAELCRRLDGLPLAIEIAAARVATLGLQAVHDQIDQRLRLKGHSRLAPSRHHTLLQTYEWSYGLLSASEQRLFRSLEPFAGGFDPAMASSLQALRSDAGEPIDAWQVQEALAALVDKSLVQPLVRAGGSASTTSLGLLESARDFARLKLQSHGEFDVVRSAHAAAVAGWFETAHHDAEHWRDQDWCQRYMPELRNVQAALTLACSRSSPELLARLVVALGQLETFGQTASDLVRAPVPLDAVLAAPIVWRALACLELGWAHANDGSRETGTELALKALADFEALGDEAGAYRTCTRLIRMYHGRPGLQHRTHEVVERMNRIDPRAVPLRSRLSFESSASYLVGAPRSPERLQQLQQLAEYAGFEDLAALCRVNLTDELMVQGRDDEVVMVARAMLERGESLPRSRALMCHNLALSLVRLGRVEEALGPAREVLHALPYAAYMVMDLFALAAARADRHDDAAVIAGCSAEIKRRRDLRTETSEAAVIEETHRRLRDAMPAQRCAELMQLGVLMDVDAVLTIALRV